MKKKVIVGLSGGVDSSVTAYLLKEQGYEVIGMFMKNWNDPSVTINNECPWIEDSNDALLIAEQLDIPYYVLDLSEEYKNHIVDYMMKEYKEGRTPNPDVLCNREIKFGHFLTHAQKLGANYVATGHYARIKNGKLYKGIDPNKDQSYFLSQLNEKQLEKILLPIGELTKDEVRKIAKEQNLITADKKDSQGLCFVGKVKLPDFLSSQLKPKAGICIDIDTREIVGQHKGAHFFTRGQRKGIGVSGSDIPYYVTHVDTNDNIIWVAKGKDHSSLYSEKIYCISNNMLSSINSGFVKEELDFQVTYHGKFYKGILNYYGSEQAVIDLVDPAFCATLGQFVVGYKNDELVYSGSIHSYYSKSNLK